MTINTGGPAYPWTELNQGLSVNRQHNGMTLRDWFAGQALAGFCANEESAPNAQCHFDALAEDSYRMADAMLAAREGE